MLSTVFVRIMNTGNPIELDGVIFLDRWERRGHLSHLREQLLFRGHGSFKFFRINLGLAITLWKRVKEIVSCFFLRDNFDQREVWYNVICSGIPNVLDGSLHVPCVKTFLYITDERLEKLGRPTINYERHVLGVCSPSGFQSLPNRHSDISDRTQRREANKPNAELRNRAGRPPTTAKGFFPLLIGSLGPWISSAWFFVLLCFNGTRCQVFQGIGFVVFFTFILHVGLYYLLAERL